MDKLKKFLIPTYIVWSTISLILVTAFIIINFCFEKPKTFGYEYFDKIKVEKVTSDGIMYAEEKPILEVNYVRSDTTKELYLAEVVITSYTDYNHTAYKRFGIQVVGKNFCYWTPAGETFTDTVEYKNSYLSTVGGDNVNYANNLKGVYFYQQDIDGVVSNVKVYDSFEKSLDILNLSAGEDEFVLELGGKNAQYSYKYYKNKIFDHFKHFFGADYKLYNVKVDYSSLDLFWELATRFYTNYEDGEYSFKNLDLDKYFTIYKKNNKNQFYTLSEVSKNTAYFTTKLNYKTITTGLKAEDSILGIVAGDSNYNATVKNDNKNSYLNTVEFELNNENLKTVYDSTINKYVVGISNSFLNYLQTLNNLEVNIVIDTSLFEKSIEGIDLSNFKNINVKSIKIVSSSLENFYVIGTNKNINKSIFDTTLKLLTNEGVAYA